MTCNAWNHPINCDCGWGGKWHGQVYREINWYGIYQHFQDPISYVNPNAICPVCRAPVYFYASPHGGRVFFDDLGPPWPKHGCTSTSRLVFTSDITFQFSKPNTQPKWQIEGWSPLIIHAITRWDSEIVVLTAMSDGKEMKIYVHLPVRTERESTFSFDRTRHIAHIRALGDSRVELSFYSFNDKQRTFIASLVSFDARSFPALV